jgi:hypothetical protein
MTYEEWYQKHYWKELRIMAEEFGRLQKIFKLKKRIILIKELIR